MKANNILLIVGISLPLFFIVVLSAFVFVPPLFVNPQYNFIYTANDKYYGYARRYSNSFYVKDNRIASKSVAIQLNKYDRNIQREEYPTLYIYDTKNNTSKEISLTDARKLSLDSGPSSPDGYNITYNVSSSGVFELFGSSRDNNGYYISKNSGKKKLTIVNDGYNNGSQNLKVIGWIK